MNVESNFFAGMKRLIRDELGARSLLSGSADHNDSYAGYAHMRDMLQFDFIEGHGYWEHPEIGRVTKIKNTPMVNDPLRLTLHPVRPHTRRRQALHHLGSKSSVPAPVCRRRLRDADGLFALARLGRDRMV